jgi:ABC-2 type transport system ATP-binding protein
MWRVIADLVRSGVSVLLTTQYLEEADQLADRIAVINSGVVVAQGSPTELKNQIAEQRLDLTMSDASSFDDVSRLLGDRMINSDPGRRTVSVATDGTAVTVRGLLDEVDPHSTRVSAFAVHVATLDDVFLALTGRPADRSDKEPAHV